MSRSLADRHRYHASATDGHWARFSAKRLAVAWLEKHGGGYVEDRKTGERTVHFPSPPDKLYGR